MIATDSRVLTLVGEIQGVLDLEEFRECLIAALRGMVGCDWVSMNEFGPQPDDVWSLVVPPVPYEILTLFPEYAHENPLVQQASTRQDGRAHRISDVMSRDQFRSLDLYRKVYAPLGLEYQMAFTLPHEPPRLLGVALSNRHRDFTDAERDLVNRARPYMIQGYRNAIEHTRLRLSTDGGVLVAGLRSAGLTEREADVMRLVALGRSNAAAAEVLGISVRTVQKHLERAFSKLGVTTRSAASERAWTLVS